MVRKLSGFGGRTQVLNNSLLRRYSVERQRNNNTIRRFPGLRCCGSVAHRKQIPDRVVWIAGCTEKYCLPVPSAGAAFTTEALRVRLTTRFSEKGKYMLLILTTNRDIALISPQRSTTVSNSLSKLTSRNSSKKLQTGPNPGITSSTAS